MQRTLTYIAARLREPSSWAGIAALVLHAPAAWAAGDWTAIGGIIAGILGVVMPEKGER
jgi:hypothetical protein